MPTTCPKAGSASSSPDTEQTARKPSNRAHADHTSPNATPTATIELITDTRLKLTAQGLDAGPDTIAWHLQHHHHITVSVSTIARTLTRHQLVTPEPVKRPKSSYIRFQAEQPNETWQSDFTHYPLATAVDVEILTWLDDHSRTALSVTAHLRVTGRIVRDTFRATTAEHGIPASTLTDSGMVYTTRFAGGHGGRNAFEAELVRLHITQKNSRPNHPTTCGKVERFQQTMKKWLRAQPAQPSTIAGLQALLDRFVDEYYHRRPHRSLPHRATPSHPQRRLHHPPQSHTDHHHHQPPPPRPPRPHRRLRRRHPAPQRTTPPHRHRTNPRP